jgi:biopolymer transport protein ExbB/TolQ
MKSNLRIIAESNPKTLLKKREFWFSQKEFILTIVPAILIGPFLVSFTYEKADLLTYVLNIIIHSFALLGVVDTAKVLAEIQVECAIVRFVEKMGTDYLKKVNNDRNASRKNLDSLSQEFVPNNQTNPPLGMIRLFQRICKEAKDRKFESSIYLVQPYREESMERVQEISNLQRIALRLGIFGTFLGLILAISQLATFQQDNQSFEQSFSVLFGNLYTSFSTSVAGLEVSIFLSFLLIALRKKQKVYFQQMEDTTLTMLSVVRNCVNKDDFLTEFKQVYNLVNELDNKIYDHGKSISIAVKGVENKVQHQTERIQKGIDELVQSRDKLTNFLNQLNQTQDKFLRKNQAEYDQIFKQFSETQKALIDEAKKIHDLLSIKDIATQLRGGLIDAGNYISESINNTEKTIDSQTTAIQKGMNRLAETELQFEQFLSVINESQTQFINDIKNINYKAEENINQQLKLNSDKLLNVISEQFRDSIINASDRISESINNTEKTINSQTTAIQQAMNNLAETQLEFGEFLNAINESQTQFINDIKNINYKAEENIDQESKLNSDKLLRVILDIKESLDKHSSLNSEKLLSVVSELTQSLGKHSSLIQEVLLEQQPRKKKSSMKIIREILGKKFF